MARRAPSAGWGAAVPEAGPDSDAGADAAATEVAGKAGFDGVRYAQCWEDADVLRRGLGVQAGDTCVSIASAGDNALALLLDDPARVIAVDLSPAQLACVDLRIQMYRELEHVELLELMGSRPAAPDRRAALYRRCRRGLSADAADWWDGHPDAVAGGIGAAGRFEAYFRVFRRWALPLMHRRATVHALLEPRGAAERTAFFERRWNGQRWRAMFRLFFSNAVMARLGRDPAFFSYVEGGVASHLLRRTRHALVELEPAANPYLQWVLTGTHTTALPLALRPEHFETIRGRVDRLELRRGTLEGVLDREPRRWIDRLNLSDIFEYMSESASDALFRRIASRLRPGGRAVYWNMAVPRRSPPDAGLVMLDELSAALHAADKAWFYSAVRVEEKPA